MGRHIDGLRTQFQQDLQQVAAGKPQDGPPVRMDVANGLQFP